MGSHRGHYCGFLFWNQKVPSIKKKKENANAKSGELINASINHMHCVTILLTFTVNQLLFTMALFCDFLVREDYFTQPSLMRILVVIRTILHDWLTARNIHDDKALVNLAKIC